MDMVEEFTLKATLKEPMPIGAGPVGTRVLYEVSGGEVTGERVRGRVLGSGDWGLITNDGFLRLDVRLQVETWDGAYLYIQYLGLLELNEAVQTALSTGGGTDYDDQYFYVNPRVETGDERYAWLNTTFLVAQGRVLSGGGVEYRVWRPA